MRIVLKAFSVCAFFLGAPFLLIGAGCLVLAKWAEDKEHEIYCRRLRRAGG